MNEKFFDLSREKQDRMINGAVEVFAMNGFKHASTDDMVKAVNVSKGLWFHYFGSKIGLYNFVYGYSVKYVTLELSSILDPNEKDFFEIMKQIEFTKMRISKKYPYMMQFLDQAAKETDEDVKAQIADDQAFYQEKMNVFMKNADIFEIEEKAQKEKIKKLVQYTIHGMMKEHSYAGDNQETVYKDVKGYIDLVKGLIKPVAQEQIVKEENEKTAAS